MMVVPPIPLPDSMGMNDRRIGLVDDKQQTFVEG
jgi:hypothetical protein